MTKPVPTERDPGVALAGVQSEIGVKEQEHERVSRLLGDAYARRQTGKDRNAPADIGKLTFQRSTIENDLRDLRLTEASLKAAVAQQRAEQDARRGELAIVEFNRVTAGARDLERQFAALMRDALAVAKQLQDTQRPWQRARGEAAPHADVSDVPAPRMPAVLLNPAAVDDQDAAVDRWIAAPVKRGPETPPRLTTPKDITPHVGLFEEYDRAIGKGDAPSFTFDQARRIA